MIEDKILKNYLANLNLNLNSQSIKKIKLFLDLIYANNKFLNLVGTKDKNSILIRHFFDCLSIFEFFKDLPVDALGGCKILDVGSGAGLPGILLAIILSNSNIYLLDSKEKFGKFLNMVIKELKIKNTNLIFGRAEVLSHNENLREKFDIVTARAVANIRILSELTIPFCRIGGTIILYKSRKLKEELPFAEKIILNLGGRVANIFDVSVPLLNEYRVLLIIKKEKTTLYKYPRKYVKMLKDIS